MPRLVHKVVPVVTRVRDSGIQLLVFNHPQERQQIVKGTLEPEEDLEDAALRELAEESGITEAIITHQIGDLAFEHKGEHQHWHFFKVEAQVELPERWEYYADEDGGMWFKLFWQDIDQPLDTPWPEVFDRSRLFIREWLTATEEDS
ncbi:MAG: NUDIX domain-containing protein [Bacteroidota bacterium]